MVRLSFLLILFNLSCLTSAHASLNQPVQLSSTTSALALYKQQCEDVGGSVNGFCMCEEKQDLLVLATTVVSIAKDISKVKQKSFQVINPFVKSCNDKDVDLKISLQRLEQIHAITLSSAKNPDIHEKILLMDELDLFHPDAFSKYMTNGKFQKSLLKKIKKMRSIQENIVKNGFTRSARALAQENTKLLAISTIEDFTGVNINTTAKVSKQVRDIVTTALQKPTRNSITVSLKEMGSNFIKSGAKSLGKGLVAGLIMTAGLETISYVTGYDVTIFDPFQVFLPTPAGDGTISGALNRQVSLTLYPDYQHSLDMGFYTNPDLFSAKLTLMALVAESFSQDQSMFAFLSK